ncbi:hypothetical protein FDX06_13740 [Citrobacter sp. wls618]|jgi:hypothetical protein|uniref:hypothetical protein n=1 Tax=Citrobacter sp. wls618 TaxID=2576433 RepID=UPI0010C96C2C|nr:hypothetical protein [Citrobacter sp. wls618]TKV03474.1 hypothetical protein FDX06_13740 [Citrobacter sp. wls618]
MKPDVKKIIADIKATKGNRKFCNGLAGTLQDDNYASSICKYVKTVTPERIDLLIEYAEKLEAEVTDMAVQLANAESKCRELAAENARVKSVASNLVSKYIANKGMDCEFITCITPSKNTIGTGGVWDMWRQLDLVLQETPATDAILAEVRAQGVEMYADNLDSSADDAERDGFDDAVKFLRSEASGVRLFAAQLRKGTSL